MGDRPSAECRCSCCSERAFFSAERDSETVTRKALQPQDLLPTQDSLLIRKHFQGFQTSGCGFSHCVFHTVIHGCVVRSQTARLHVGCAPGCVPGHSDTSLEFLCVLVLPFLRKINPIPSNPCPWACHPQLMQGQCRCIRTPCRRPSWMPLASSAQPQTAPAGPGVGGDDVRLTGPVPSSAPGRGAPHL